MKLSAEALLDFAPIPNLDMDVRSIRPFGHVRVGVPVIPSDLVLFIFFYMVGI